MTDELLTGRNPDGDRRLLRAIGAIGSAFSAAMTRRDDDALRIRSAILSAVDLVYHREHLPREVRQLGIQVPPYRFRILEHLQTALTAHIKVVATVISRNVGRWRSE